MERAHGDCPVLDSQKSKYQKPSTDFSCGGWVACICSTTLLDDTIITKDENFSLAHLIHWLSKNNLKAHKVSSLFFFFSYLNLK